jgi:coenzyme F420-0:L-glutamate ligase/coenzyme F420-1:gamma-L-glutamate ligase
VTLEVIPVRGLPEIGERDDLAALLTDGAAIRDGDVVVVTQKVVSKQEGRLVLAADRDAAIAAETVRMVARRDDLVITETRHGFVCANAGVDASNVADGMLTLLPEDPDGSAARLREDLVRRTSVRRLGVVITDTFGRPWREGLVEVAIGCAGMEPLLDLRGRADLQGRTLHHTVVALADEVAGAAGLVMEKDSRVAAAIVRGVRYTPGRTGAAAALVRRPELDLFR